MQKLYKHFVLWVPAMVACLWSFAVPGVQNSLPQNIPLSFMENRGMITDQNHQPRTDIQYSMKAAGGLNIFIGNGAIHYQFSKLNATGGTASGLKPGALEKLANGYTGKTGGFAGSGSYTMDRMDVELLGADKNAQVIAGDASDYFERHIALVGGQDNGAVSHAYNKLTYKNIYPGIDWVLTVKNGQLEHEFVVHQGARISDIQLKYGGTTSLTINADGSLTATTAMGTVTEHAPNTYQLDGRKVSSSFVLQDGVLSYYTGDYSGDLVIDPSLTWATYYGGTGDDEAGGIHYDGAGNIYFTGYTTSTSLIATSGAYLTTFEGAFDVFLAKFNSSGAIQCATYYGGSDTDQAIAVTNDASGNIYITGMTKSTAGIATSGAYQAVQGGDYDAFLAKFTSAGSLAWATYLGGSSFDEATSVTTDAAGNVYIAGTSGSTSGIATSGAWQTTMAGVQNAFVAEFNSLGAMQWATYYGGEATDIGDGISVDGSGNVYVGGGTSSTTGIATTGAHQVVNAGGAYDGFIAKFTTSGALEWGTYYGGSGDDEMGGLITDISGNVIVSGLTSSLGTIASTGAYQTTMAGVYDAFLAKFNSSGVIQWGTYYGGPAYDGGGIVTTDATGNIYINGSTSSSTGIASSGAIQPTFGGGTFDGFVAEFSGAGALLFGTYFGSSGDDYAGGLAADGTGNVYFAGNTTSTSGIATSGAYQNFFGGGPGDAYLGKMNICTIPVVNPITGTASVCQGATTTLNETSTGGSWSVGSAIALVGTAGAVTGMHEGIAAVSYTVTNACGSVSAVRMVTVNALPAAVAITPATTATVCLGTGSPFTAATTAAVTLLYQDFNNGMTGEIGGAWNIVNTGTSTVYNWGIYAPAAFTDVLGYTGTALTGDGTPYMGSDPDLAGGSVSVNSILYSPNFSTVGYSAAALTFNYFLTTQEPFDLTMEIDYSLDGGVTWALLTNYLAGTAEVSGGSETWTAGTPTATTPLPPALIGQPNVMLRWNYSSNFGYWWAIDNVMVSGTSAVSSYTWAGIAGATGLSCTSCATTTITPTATGNNVYSVTATSTAGCSAAAGLRCRSMQCLL